MVARVFLPSLRRLQPPGGVITAAWGLWAIVFGLLLIMGAISLRTGLYIDEGTFLAIAKQMQRGEILYRDIGDNKMPLLYMLLVPVVRFFPADILVARVFAWLCFAVATALFHLLMKREFDRGQAFVLTLLWLAVAFGLDVVGVGLVSETVILPFLMGFYLLFFEAKRRLWQDILLGVCGAVALGINQHAFFLVTPLLYALVISRRRFAVISGLLLVALPVAYYFFRYGVWGDFLAWTLREPVQNVNKLSGIENLLYLIAAVFPLALLSLRLHRFRWMIFWLMPALAIGVMDVSFVKNSRKIIYLLPAVFYYAGLSSFVLRRMRLRFRGILLTVFVLLALIAKIGYLDKMRATGYVTLAGYASYSPEPYVPQLDWLTTYKQQKAVAQYLRERGATEIHIFGHNTEFYYLSGAAPVTPVIHLWQPYVYRFYLDPAYFETVILAPLESRRPQFILYNRNYGGISFFKGMDAYLAANYRLAADFAGLEVYERIDAARAAALE